MKSSFFAPAAPALPSGRRAFRTTLQFAGEIVKCLIAHSREFLFLPRKQCRFMLIESLFENELAYMQESFRLAGAADRQAPRGRVNINVETVSSTGIRDRGSCHRGVGTILWAVIEKYQGLQLSQ